MPYYYVIRDPEMRFKFYEKKHLEQSRVMRWVEDQWVLMYSKSLWLKTAVDTIALGRPLILPKGYSPALLRPATTFSSEQVTDLVRRYGPADPADLKGVSNWLNYDERMQFIVAYFMGYQQIRQMFDEPRFRRKRHWKKPRLIDPLGDLEFHRVTL
jgi:hypothetical protein